MKSKITLVAAWISIGLVVLLSGCSDAKTKARTGSTSDGEQIVRSINPRSITLADGETIPLPPNNDIFILVRHAEKDTTTGSNPVNPNLSPEGVKRAMALANILADSDVTGVYSTPYFRTLQTASETAAKARLKVTPYRAAGLPKLVRDLTTNTAIDRALVVGHSNTVHSTVNQLVKKTYFNKSIPESEYGLLYVVVMEDPVKVHTLRY